MLKVPVCLFRKANVATQSRLKGHIGGIAFGVFCDGPGLRQGKQLEVQVPFRFVGRLAAQRC